MMQAAVKQTETPTRIHNLGLCRLPRHTAPWDLPVHLRMKTTICVPTADHSTSDNKIWPHPFGGGYLITCAGQNAQNRNGWPVMCPGSSSDQLLATQPSCPLVGGDGSVLTLIP